LWRCAPVLNSLLSGAHFIGQWPRAPGHHNPPLDGFTIRRTGDLPTKVRIVMYLAHFPDQFKVLPELGVLSLLRGPRSSTKYTSQPMSLVSKKTAERASSRLFGTISKSKASKIKLTGDLFVPMIN
jgi:hypothetical protein